MTQADKTEALENVMTHGIGMLDHLLRSNPAIPEPVTDLVRDVLNGTAKLVTEAVGVGLAIAGTSRKEI
jgi:hypothetical protein